MISMDNNGLAYHVSTRGMIPLEKEELELLKVLLALEDINQPQKEGAE